MNADPFKNRVRTRSSALVIKGEKLLLVKQNAPTRKKPIWLPPGGEVHFGETAREAAERETLEETGLFVSARKLAFIHEFIEKPFHAIELYFFADVEGGKLKAGTDPELLNSEQQIITCEFVDLRKLLELRVFPEFLRDWNAQWFESESIVERIFTTSKL